MLAFIDFETASKATLDTRANSELSTDAFNYCRHPSTRVLCVAFAIDDDDPQLMCESELSDCPIPPDATIVAHNIAFDLEVWNAVMVRRYGWPSVSIDQCHCTAAIAAYHGLPRNLDEVGQTLGIDNPKDRRFKTTLSTLSNLNNRHAERYLADPEKLELLHRYCMQDVRACRDIFRKLGPLPEEEHRVFLFDYRINQRGIRVDTQAVEHTLRLISQHAEHTQCQISRLTDGAITSGGQVAKILSYCSDRGVNLPNLQKLTLSRALSNGLPDDVRALLQLRQQASATSLGKYPTLRNRTDSQTSRLRDSLRYYGSHTGRWSGAGVQLQNLPRPAIDLSPDELDQAVRILSKRSLPAIELLFGPVTEVLQTLVRSMLVASPGCELFAADFAQIEARALPWLAGQNDVVDAFRAGRDIYRETAAQLYGIQSDQVSKEQRTVGKEVRLSCGYGLGHVKFRERCRDLYGVELTPAESERIVSRFRAQNRRIVGWWKQLETAAIRCVVTGKSTACRNAQFAMEGGFLTLRLPSNRTLYYPHPEVKPHQTPWGDVTRQLEVSLPHQGKSVRRNIYGALLAENITQAVCRDILVKAMFALERAGYRVVLTVHDEIVCEREAGTGSLDEVLGLMRHSPEWAQDLPIDAEGFVGQRYRK